MEFDDPRLLIYAFGIDLHRGTSHVQPCRCQSVHEWPQSGRALAQGVSLCTNICIHAWQKQHPRVLARMRRIKPENLVVSSLVAAKLASSAMYSQRAEHNRRWLEQALALYVLEPWRPEAVWHYGQQWARLRAAGTPIGAIDLLIGCQALAENGIVVTHNVREFERIEGLRIEDWMD